MTEELLHTTDLVHARVSRHPALALYETVFAVALPAVSVIAAQKNIPLRDHEQESILRHALDTVRRKTMRQVLQGNKDAIFSLQLSINHSLDVLASARMVWAFAVAAGEDVSDLAALVKTGEEALKPGSANDKGPTMIIWPDPAQAVTNCCNRLLQPQSPGLSPPDGARMRSTFRLSGKEAAQ
jgi:hypothetical protein